ncbi:MAG: ABC transporter permease [Bacteroidetes bacterium]|nr:ABC transporter permease [Bacteroidota bacterium]
MLFTLPWRNIWRSPVRSLVVMGAIIIGVWSVIFLISMISGMIDGYVDMAISNEVSHVQVHHPEFINEKESKFYFEEYEERQADIRQIEGVEAVSARSLTNAMIASSRSSRGIRLCGIEPDTEKNVTDIHEDIIEGSYFEGAKRNSIVISQVLADKLKVKLKSKVVVTFQSLDSEITAGAFRIVGIFKTGNKLYDESISFVKQGDLNVILGKANIAHEMAVLLKDVSYLDTTKQQIAGLFPNLKVRTYAEIAPELKLFQSQIQMAQYIYMVIFMLALIFGIINTMLMAVLERMKEIGMLMAVGMNKFRVFSMIVLETIYIGLVSAPIGLLLGYLTTLYFSKNGLDLFFFSEEGMNQFGMTNFVYPRVDSETYLIMAIAVAITAILASLYPAWKAIRLRPVEAIRKL